MKRMTVLTLALAALVCASVRISVPARQCAIMRSHLARMQSQAVQLLADIEQLEDAISSADDRETIELLARRELGLVYPGEIVFYYAGN